MGKSKMKQITKMFLLLFFFSAISSLAEENKSKLNSSVLSGLKFRSIGPAQTSGRVIDFAVQPNDFNTFYVAIASGGVWKTTNKGTTFTPVFDKENSYSISTVRIDPNNHNVVWVGTGENNSQRAVAYGDGVYKSCDGGNTWKNMGLKTSEHIGDMLIDPRNSNVVYVASQGPLWSAGGERGLYKTTDGGSTWNNILEISENTGVSDIDIDPRDPDVIYAVAYQRRRHVFTLINGGPESALYKSTDAGKTWNKLTNGIPGGELGRIGIAVSPANPDVIYAIIEADGDKGGLFKSTDRGASWNKMNNHKSSSAQYYQELVCDPKDPDVVYLPETYTRYSKDGGKTFNVLPVKNRHVDDHALWINPDNTKNMLIGGDGGVYESYDGGNTWRFFENLPTIQFYRVAVDYDKPFYNVYAGTQDNNTLNGPSRTTGAYGILNQDWSFPVGGDGFEPACDPEDPNTAYVESQYGGIMRYNRQNGEITSIKPMPEEGEELRWNWNAPIIISPHNHKTLYFAANKLFKSTDRGDTWKKVSEDLTAQIDRNQLEVMDKLWSPEAVAKNGSTSLYGNLVAIDESPKKAGLLYVGTDDGLLQVSDNDGASWTKYSSFPGVPANTYVSDVVADLFDENTVYISFDNRKRGDFKSYVLKSNDKGKSWTSIAANLPKDQTVHALLQDHVDKNLLFAGTEKGIFFTADGGKEWVQLKAGLPTIAVRDIEIQRRENDLVIATFGRGIYILDDYTPLRKTDLVKADKKAEILPVREALLFVPNTTQGKNWHGDTFYRADNPPFGAEITYYIKDVPKTKEAIRKEEEGKLKDGEKLKYPSFAELRAEDLEESAYLLFSISDANGNHIRNIKTPYAAGMQRVVWDLKYSDTSPITAKTDPNSIEGVHVMVLPGKYYVSMSEVVDGKVTKLSEKAEINVKMLDNYGVTEADYAQNFEFRRDIQKLQQEVFGFNNILSETDKKVKTMKKAALATAGVDLTILEDIRAIQYKLEDIDLVLSGNNSIKKRNGNQTLSIKERLDEVMWSVWYSSEKPTTTSKDSYVIAEKQLIDIKSKLQQLDMTEISKVAKALDTARVPWYEGK